MVGDQEFKISVMGIFLVLVLLAWIAVGILMVYSALSGKGISKPDKNASSDIRVQYSIRGFIGIAFVLFGSLLLYKIFRDMF